MAATEISAGSALGEDGRYRLEAVLGTGGMASVWLATDARLERPVAVKVLSDVLALDADYVLRFEREARVAASLSHPHLVNVYDFSVIGRRPYLVMEYVAGGTLADRLRQPGGGGWRPEVLAREMLDAVGYIHAAGIIHRDIKPANILIGEDGRARITDFGIAQPLGATRMTSTGLVVGTARYIAPEVLSGQPADERSDLFACGVLLRECGQTPLSRTLSTLVDRLTASDPDRRPQSAPDALRILDRPAATATRRLSRTHIVHRPRKLIGASSAARPRVVRQGRDIEVRLTKQAAGAIAALLVLILGLILLAHGGGSNPAGSRSTLRAPTAGAPLRQQLDQLDQAIGQARR